MRISLKSQWKALLTQRSFLRHPLSQVCQSHTLENQKCMTCQVQLIMGKELDRDNPYWDPVLLRMISNSNRSYRNLIRNRRSQGREITSDQLWEALWVITKCQGDQGPVLWIDRTPSLSTQMPLKLRKSSMRRTSKANERVIAPPALARPHLFLSPTRHVRVTVYRNLSRHNPLKKIFLIYQIILRRSNKNKFLKNKNAEPERPINQRNQNVNPVWRRQQ